MLYNDKNSKTNNIKKEKDDTTMEYLNANDLLFNIFEDLKLANLEKKNNRISISKFIKSTIINWYNKNSKKISYVDSYIPKDDLENKEFLEDIYKSIQIVRHEKSSEEKRYNIVVIGEEIEKYYDKMTVDIDEYLYTKDNKPYIVVVDKLKELGENGYFITYYPIDFDRDKYSIKDKHYDFKYLYAEKILGTNIMVAEEISLPKDAKGKIYSSAYSLNVGLIDDLNKEFKKEYHKILVEKTMKKVDNECKKYRNIIDSEYNEYFKNIDIDSEESHLMLEKKKGDKNIYFTETAVGFICKMMNSNFILGSDYFYKKFNILLIDKPDTEDECDWTYEVPDKSNMNCTLRIK